MVGVVRAGLERAAYGTSDTVKKLPVASVLAAGVKSMEVIAVSWFQKPPTA